MPVNFDGSNKPWRSNTMSAHDDDEKAYTTYDGIVGRSFRRGIRKGLKAVTLGILGGDPAGGAAKHLAEDAAEELVTKVIPRSRDKD
jgi:hypothetical protein